VTSDSSAPFICLSCKAHILKYVPQCPECKSPNAVRCVRAPVVSPAPSESPETIRARINPALVSTDPSAKYHCACCGIFVLEYPPTQGYCPACAKPNVIRLRRLGSASESRSSIVTTIERCEGQPLERIMTGLLGLDAATGGGFVRRGCYLSESRDVFGHNSM
jgi:predicted ATP-dependent serine protease